MAKADQLDLGFHYPIKSLQITLNNLENLVLIHDKEQLFLPDGALEDNEQAEEEDKVQLTSLSKEEIDVIKKRIGELKNALSLLHGEHTAVQKLLLKLG